MLKAEKSYVTCILTAALCFVLAVESATHILGIASSEKLLKGRACTRAFGLQMSSSESVAATEESAPSPGAPVRPRDFHLQYLYARLQRAEPFHNCIILRPQVSFFESLLGSTFCNCHLLLYSEERIWVCITRLSRETHRCLSSSLRLTA